MAYRLERASNATIELEVGNETLVIPITGMTLYKKVLEAQGRLREVQAKIETLAKNKVGITQELIQYLGETVLYLFGVAFGKENTDKIVAFYEGNYDEMLLKVYPFFINHYLPELKENARAESRNYAKQLAGNQ